MIIAIISVITILIILLFWGNMGRFRQKKRMKKEAKQVLVRLNLLFVLTIVVESFMLRHTMWQLLKISSR